MMERLWGTLADALSSWSLVRETLPHGTWGLTRFDRQEVVIDRDLTEVEAHCTLVHELEHVARGPAPPGWEAQEENRVNRITARRLLPNVAAVADALAWADWQIEVAAEELGVDEDVLAWRLNTMSHPAELGYMRKRFEDEGESHAS